jgi:hypothetical protein
MPSRGQRPEPGDHKLVNRKRAGGPSTVRSPPGYQSSTCSRQDVRACADPVTLTAGDSESRPMYQTVKRFEYDHGKDGRRPQRQTITSCFEVYQAMFLRPVRRVRADLIPWQLVTRDAVPSTKRQTLNDRMQSKHRAITSCTVRRMCCPVEGDAHVSKCADIRC